MNVRTWAEERLDQLRGCCENVSKDEYKLWKATVGMESITKFEHGREINVRLESTTHSQTPWNFGFFFGGGGDHLSFYGTPTIIINSQRHIYLGYIIVFILPHYGLWSVNRAAIGTPKITLMCSCTVSLVYVSPESGWGIMAF